MNQLNVAAMQWNTSAARKNVVGKVAALHVAKRQAGATIADLQ